jgi:hypothetical protein
MIDFLNIFPNALYVLRSIFQIIPLRSEHNKGRVSKIHFLKKESRRQHQADKGGLPIIVSFPWVRSNSIVPSKKLHNYANSLHLYNIKGKYEL